MVLRLPLALGLSVEANVLRSFAALQSRLGLSDEEIKKVVLVAPAVLSLSVEANVPPKLDFLQRVLRLSDETLRERVVRTPVILSDRLEDRLRPRVELSKELGLPVEHMLFSSYTKKPDDFEAPCRRLASK